MARLNSAQTRRRTGASWRDSVLAFGGGGDRRRQSDPTSDCAATLWLAVLMLLGAEAMFFAGLIGAFLVFRIANPVWPPPFQPRLPIEVTGVNTVILLASAMTIRLGLKAIQRGDRSRLGAPIVMDRSGWARCFYRSRDSNGSACFISA